MLHWIGTCNTSSLPCHQPDIGADANVWCCSAGRHYVCLLPDWDALIDCGLIEFVTLRT
jgi:hypothetical protein